MRHVRPSATASLAALLLLAPLSAFAQQPLSPGEMAKRVGIDQKLGDRLPEDLSFVDSTGAPVRLGDLLHERPLVLALVYYECPMLCGIAMEGLTRNMKVLGLELGVDYDVVTVSIDPGETPAIAAGKKRDYMTELGRDDAGARAAWHALTGEQDAISRLAETVGFRYVYLPETDEYAHGAAIMVITAGGEISRYYYGVEYPARDLRLGIVEAARGSVGSVTDQILLLCYHYDPVTGKYGFAIWSVLRLAGILTVAGIAIFIVSSVRRDRSASREAVAVAGGNHERD